jgi:TPR repeat protein
MVVSIGTATAALAPPEHPQPPTQAQLDAVRAAKSISVEFNGGRWRHYYTMPFPADAQEAVRAAVQKLADSYGLSMKPSGGDIAIELRGYVFDESSTYVSSTGVKAHGLFGKSARGYAAIDIKGAKTYEFRFNGLGGTHAPQQVYASPYTTDVGRGSEAEFLSLAIDRAVGDPLNEFLYRAIGSISANDAQRRLCDSGNAGKCVDLALALDGEKATPAQRAQAVALYAKGCDGGNAAGCTDLGLLYADGQGVTSDPAKAAELYRKGCDSGSAPGCTNLARSFDAGRGVPQDKHEATGLFNKACEANEPYACYWLARRYDDGVDVAQDKVVALRLYQQACQGGRAAGCTNAGYMYSHGEGAARDYAKAAQLYQQGCDGGNPDACVNLGGLNERGLAPGGIPAAAMAFYEKACAADNARGCFALGNLYDKGTAVAKDAAKAADFFKKACVLGDRKACTLAAGAQ